jgi:hypothetical protein
MQDYQAAFHHLLNLIRHTWEHFVAGLGTTTLGFIVAASIPILIVLVTLLAILKSQGLTAALEHWNSNVRKTGKFAGSVTLTVWLGLFTWNMVWTIYDDHEQLVSENDKLAAENKELGGEATRTKSRPGKERAGQPHRVQDGFYTPQQPPTIFVPESTLANLRRVGAEGNMIQTEFFQENDKRKVKDKYTMWLSKATTLLSSADRASSEQFKNASPMVGGCIPPYITKIDDCVDFQDIAGKVLKFSVIVSQMNSK